MTRRKLPEDIEQMLDELVGDGVASNEEVEAAIDFFDGLADRELSGDLADDEALSEVIDFAMRQLEARNGVPS